MDTGLLILRLLAGVLLGGHAVQKLFGWYGGAGLVRTGALFEQWGHRPGPAMAALAGTCELTGGAMLAAGLLTPLAAAIVAGTMVVACVALAPNGVWAVKGGFELPFVYAVIAVALAFTGAGRWSLDHALGLDLQGAGWGLAALGLVGATSGVALARRRPAPAPA
jgi:putative oxidoreductase